ncbi:16S rRNA (guanine(527)-N(7))-methyltransferase RsmG [Candidatus Epulonipiscium viviparus]|uniref:16S rRNA (guanine(527)-N(7))-methyltransferase RsmG n=1 Tax=Candidatus Epulonipiscium viviparus TaxID=420336 RepID=UPI0027380B65|nr:16S rRNA (guanine(527)-N(7))-methyltransferase RsmG [Candidatus Epulopiscium viviparus]
MHQFLKEKSAELGVELQELQIQQLLQYKDLLLEWNQKLNLTAITKEDEIITKHFLDSLSVNMAVDLLKYKNLVDVGTGAGFPGLVLKIAYPHLNIVLVDSLKKRLTFLDAVIETLKLKHVVTVHGRAEDIAKDVQYREKFDICSPRAVSNLATLSEYALPFVRTGGYFIALKGQKLDEEVAQATNAIKILGGELERVVDVPIPATDIVHKIAVIKKVGFTNKKYPRKAGEPAKNPL